MTKAEDTLNFFTENIDTWGAAEWFNRLAKAIRQQNAAVLAGDTVALEICRNVAASSAMRLVSDFEQQVRDALRLAAQADAQGRCARCGSSGDTYVLCSGCGAPAPPLSIEPQRDKPD